MTTFGCDEFRDIAPDLALGLLAGNERGAAISHLATCGPCRSHLDGLVQVADYLVLLAPSVEPAIGFESRVMARLAADGAFAPAASGAGPTAATTGAAIGGASGTAAGGAAASGAGATGAPATTEAPITGTAATTEAPIGGTAASTGAAIGGARGRARRRWSRPVTVAVAAALVAVLGVSGVVAGFNRARDEGRAAAFGQEAHAARQLAAQAVVVWADAGKSTCQLVAFARKGSQPARLVIHLDEPTDPSDIYQVFAVPSDGGPAFLVGQVIVSDGQGTLSATLPNDAGLVDAVRVMEGPGDTKYRATFSPV